MLSVTVAETHTIVSPSHLDQTIKIGGRVGLKSRVFIELHSENHGSTILAAID